MGAANEVNFEEMATKPLYDTTPKKYKKKPVVIEAYQTDKEMDIDTLEGVMHANPGDWIITGVNGETYPCKPDIFEKTYAPWTLFDEHEKDE